MFNALKVPLLRLLRVPSEPTPPEGGRVIRVFQAAPNYFRMKLILWGLSQLGPLAGLVFGFLFIRIGVSEFPEPWLRSVLEAVEIVAWGLYLIQLPVSIALVRLDFEMRWYILTDRSLRIREGVLSVREKTLTFANIQQISIRQNPLHRLLGIADVHVSTAGGGAPGGSDGSTVRESMSEAFFRGVDNAEEIRTVIKERIRLHRDTGLGNPDEPAPLAPTAPPPATEAVAAAIELRNEIRALVLSLTSA
jgi:uncharacterized membrane protein YdbT with pleckstrin-like domain